MRSDFFRKSNMSILKRIEREKGTQSLFKQIINENFPNLWKKMNPHIQGANKP